MTLKGSSMLLSTPMKRDLTEPEIRQLLQNQHYGHLACCAELEKPYLIPVSYVFKDAAIICYSYTGEKIDIMHSNPHVCFQTEELINDTSWQSAMIHGAFRELSGEQREQGFTLLIEKFWDAYNNKTSIYFPFRNPDASLSENDIVIFAIDINEKTGRFESYEQ